MKVVKHRGLPLVAASWFELIILATGFVIIVLNSPIIRINAVSVNYEYEERIMQSLPEIKNEVGIKFANGSFNASETFKPYFKESKNILRGYYVGGVKPMILVSINQTYEDVWFVLLHELGHHNWNNYLTDGERESFCENSAIEAKIGYEENEWCEESYADYYARQEMINYENRATLSG